MMQKTSQQREQRDDDEGNNNNDDEEKTGDQGGKDESLVEAARRAEVVAATGTPANVSNSRSEGKRGRGSIHPYQQYTTITADSPFPNPSTLFLSPLLFSRTFPFPQREHAHTHARTRSNGGNARLPSQSRDSLALDRRRTRREQIIPKRKKEKNRRNKIFSFQKIMQSARNDRSLTRDRLDQMSIFFQEK
jgi:hypothetical protein